MDYLNVFSYATVAHAHQDSSRWAVLSPRWVIYFFTFVWQYGSHTHYILKRRIESKKKYGCSTVNLHRRYCSASWLRDRVTWLIFQTHMARNETTFGKRGVWGLTYWYPATFSDPGAAVIISKVLPDSQGGSQWPTKKITRQMHDSHTWCIDARSVYAYWSSATMEAFGFNNISPRCSNPNC